MPTDYAIEDHKLWLGYLQPDGLVVSPAAMVDVQVLVNRNTLPLQQRFLPYVSEVEPIDGRSVKAITDFATFVTGFLEWPREFVFGLDSDRPVPVDLSDPLIDYSETLSPDLAVRDPRAKDPAKPWMLLVKTLPPATDLDRKHSEDAARWAASEVQRFERLLRDTGVPIGLLVNTTQIRLIYAPRGESAGRLTFNVADMVEVAGRPMLGGFDLLLNCERLFAAPTEARLPALLQRSRDYQTAVSVTLAAQVLDALYELLRGFQAANERTGGELLGDLLKDHPDEIYAGIVGVLLRLVFLLYAEDRGLLPATALYDRNYSVHGLYKRLAEDSEWYPDTMDQRYGAWAGLLPLFRAIHAGSKHPQMQMPARGGNLFDPERYPFLEGRTCNAPKLPMISDG
ncbi:MAG TPA: class I SAM-dependent DNA methyltransferase, partial [Blastocatellia bacterium]|nr:class I SAM-dependent DNA methyltransferase [Blastocatellia bacterium]